MWDASKSAPNSPSACPVGAKGQWPDSIRLAIYITAGSLPVDKFTPPHRQTSLCTCPIIRTLSANITKNDRKREEHYHQHHHRHCRDAPRRRCQARDW